MLPEGMGDAFTEKAAGTHRCLFISTDGNKQKAIFKCFSKHLVQYNINTQRIQ